MSKFSVHGRTAGSKAIVYDSDDIRMCVGEVSNDRGHGWRLHFNAMSGALTASATTELTAFAVEQIVLIKVTEKLSR